MKTKRIQFICIFIVLLFTGAQLTAANRTASTSGNWSSTSTWGGQSVPTSADDVTISSGYTVTVDIAAECLSLTIISSNSNSTLTISGTNSLSIFGMLSMTRPSYGEVSTININGGYLISESLEMVSPNSNRREIINLTSGTLTVSGGFSAGTSGCEINISGAGTVNFGGALSGAPALTTASGSAVNYSGSGSQQILSGTYNGAMSIAGTGYKVLTAATTVVENLILTSGTLENGTYLTIADGATITRAQGNLSASPVFAGTVNIVYSGATSITSSYEMPVTSSTLNDLTINSGGLIQGGTPGAIVNILTDAFGNLDSWTGNIGTSYNQFTAYNSSNAGGSSREVRYAYGYSSSTSYSSSIYRSVNTSGYVSLNISWYQFLDNYNADSYPYTLKVQCATSSSGPWTDMYSLTPTGTQNIGPEINRVSNWTTNVGGTFYIRFLAEGRTYGLDFWYFDNLVIDGQDPKVPSTVTVNGDLNITSGVYSIENNTLNIAGTFSGANSIVGSTQSNLIVSGSGASLLLPEITGGLNNLTISRGNGVTLDNDLTLSGILNLQSSNPSATQGLLETGSNALTMEESASTIGAGDVTGLVRRTDFLANKIYTFGNEFTSVSFAATGTYPSLLEVKIAIGASPAWAPDAINRLYDFVQIGGANCNATISSHYLDTELNGVEEDNLVHWTNGTPGPPLGLFNWGKSSNNTTNNWVSISNIGIENFPTSFGQLENTLAADVAASYTWNGSVSSDWNEQNNWTPSVGVPTGVSSIVIPDAALTDNDPSLPASASVNMITLESGGILNGSSSSVFTVNGANGAWTNEGGTFNPSDGNVIFTNVAATISGTSDFYDLTIADGAVLTPGTDSYLGITNTITLDGSGVLLSVLNHNTIDYKGADQTVIVPNGPTPGYHNLVLSGSGTKTMPASALGISGFLGMSGTALANIGGSLSIGESLSMSAGNSLNLGTYSHTIGGDFSNAGGTLTSDLASLVFDGVEQQTITNSAGMSLDNLRISNTDAAVVLGSSTDCSIAGDLLIDTDAVFDLGDNVLSAVSGSVLNSGTLITQNTSANPIPSGKTWGGVLEMNGSTAQTIVEGTYNDMKLSNPAGVLASADIAINGLLTLSSPNPSATLGSLDMGSYTLLFGPSSTTVGLGEVSGIMRRTTILPNTIYTYGHENTFISFPDVGTLPTEFRVKLAMGASPDWKPEAMERIYDLAQSGGDGTQAILYAHYLDSELNGNNEGDIVDWLNFSASGTIVEYGRSSNDSVANWLAISNVNVGVFASTFSYNEITFSNSELLRLTWNGSTSTSWVTATNWTPTGAPSDSTEVIIPDASTTTFDPEIPALATCKSVTIESGGILNAADLGNLTLKGNSFSWNNNGGTFNPGTGTVTFSSANAKLSGSNEFHSIIIDPGASLSLDSLAYLGLTGSFSNLGALNATGGPTTVEYKGADQDVASTNRLTNSYSTLILSGSGIKTLPSVPMLVDEDFILSGTVNALADTIISVNGDFTIQSGTTFTTGDRRHTFFGDLVNDGTLLATGSNLIFSGTTRQILDGSSASIFDSLTVNNAVELAITSDALTSVTGTLIINNGMRLAIGAGNHLTVSGVLTNNSDYTGLEIESDATGTGSLIHNTVGVEGTVQRYMESNSWNIYSPSVIGHSAPGFLTNVLNNIPTKTSVYGMMSYSESLGEWQYFTIPAAGVINEGTGYLLRHTTDDAVRAYGPLNSESKVVSISRVGNGWNCVGNPFPCAIGVRDDALSTENFLTYNAGSLDPSYASLYLWDEPAGQIGGDHYKVISNAAFTPSRPILDMSYLQSGQGFLVKSLTGGASVTFTDAMRVHDNTVTFVKAIRKSWPGIVFSVSSESKSASTSITFNENMTKGLDITYDAGLLGGDPAFRVYSRLVEDNGVNFMLQCLPDYDFENMVVPLGMDCSAKGMVSFSMEAYDLPTGFGAFLEDSKKGIMTDLTAPSSSYSVMIDTAEYGTGRFYLHFADDVTSLNTDKSEKVFFVYYRANEIVVKGEVGNDSHAQLIDISGRIIQHFILEKKEINLLPVSALKPGIYMLHINGRGIDEIARMYIQ